MFCNICQRVINCASKTKVSRHLKSHQSSSSLNSTFLYELTKIFLASDIPLNKLNNPVLKEFFRTYTQHNIANPSTLRRCHVNRVHKDVVAKIKDEIADNYVYFIIDETIDACKRFIANFLVGTLKNDCAGNSHLWTSKFLDKTTDKTIVDFVLQSFNSLWPNGNYSCKVLLMLTDATQHMVKAGEILSKMFPLMIHLTCSTRAFDKIVETISESFPLGNNLLSAGSKIFVKAPRRRNIFKEILPNASFPPKLVAIRWSTWLQAVTYYFQYFDDLKQIIFRFDPTDNSAIHKAQELLNNESLYKDLKYINNNYSMLESAIQKLEKPGLTLNDQLLILQDITQQINTISTHVNAPLVSVTIQEKMSEMFQENPGYSTLESICKYLNSTYQELPSNLLKYKSCIMNFSYCPITSLDVGKSFRLHKLILNDPKRRNFTPGNLEKYLIINYEYSHLG